VLKASVAALWGANRRQYLGREGCRGAEIDRDEARAERLIRFDLYPFLYLEDVPSRYKPRTYKLYELHTKE
jgi:hypothetical protein